MKKIYLISLLSLSTSLFAMQTFYLPVNDALEPGRRLKLKIEIPNEFEMLPVMNSGEMEFVLKGTTRNTSTELITIHEPVNDVVKAATMKESLAATKNLVKKTFSELKVYNDDFEDRNSHQMGLLALGYLKKLTQETEITLTQIYTGPKNFSGYQYSVILSDKEKVAATLKKLKYFSRDNAVLVNY